MPGSRPWIDLSGRDATLEVGQRQRASEDGRPELFGPVGVALLARDGERAALDHIGRGEQRPSERVDACDVRVKEVGAAHALAPQLRVEVEAASREAARPEDLVEREGELIDRVRELIRVPTVLVIAAIDVDAAEETERDRVGHLVVEAVARQSGVVDLEVQAVFVGEPVSLQEPDDGRNVVVVLMLGRLLWLRLDEQRSGESDPLLVLRDQREKPRELRFLPGEVGVEEGFVAFAPTPEHVVRSLETMRDLEHRFHLSGRVREDLRIRIRRRAGRITRMREEVRGPPQKSGFRARHVRLDL